MYADGRELVMLPVADITLGEREETCSAERLMKGINLLAIGTIMT